MPSGKSPFLMDGYSFSCAATMPEIKRRTNKIYSFMGVVNFLAEQKYKKVNGKILIREILFNTIENNSQLYYFLNCNV